MREEIEPDMQESPSEMAIEQAAHWGTSPNRWSAIIKAWCDAEEDDECE